MQVNPRLKLAVLGSATVPEDSPVGRIAFEVGREAAAQGLLLLTGGCPGLPHAAALGARQGGGFTIAVSPAIDIQEHTTRYGYPADSDAIIHTGMGTKGRNVILVRSADACVFVGGGMGTLNEFTIAFDEMGADRAIGVLAETGGISGELPGLSAKVGKEARAGFVVDSDPRELVRALVDLVGISRAPRD